MRGELAEVLSAAAAFLGRLTKLLEVKSALMSWPTLPLISCPVALKSKTTSLSGSFASPVKVTSSLLANTASLAS